MENVADLGGPSRQHDAEPDVDIRCERLHEDVPRRVDENLERREDHERVHPCRPDGEAGTEPGRETIHSELLSSDARKRAHLNDVRDRNEGSPTRGRIRE